jgi:hypothetical protein
MVAKTEGLQDVAVDAWTLKINDPTLIAWMCVAGYSIAAFVCAAEGKSTSRAGERRFWRGLAVSCVVLGLNKQLDVHSYILEMLRGFAGRSSPAIKLSGMLLAVTFAVAGTWALLSVLANWRVATKRMKMAGLAVLLLGVVLAGRNTVSVLSHALGWHIFTEGESLLHIHVSELIELLLAAVIAYCAAVRKPVQVCGTGAAPA